MTRKCEHLPEDKNFFFRSTKHRYQFQFNLRLFAQKHITLYNQIDFEQNYWKI